MLQLNDVSRVNPCSYSCREVCHGNLFEKCESTGISMFGKRLSQDGSKTVRSCSPRIHVQTFNPQYIHLTPVVLV